MLRINIKSFSLVAVIAISTFSFACKGGGLNFGKVEDANQIPQDQKPAPQLPPIAADGNRTSYADVVDRTSPAVVRITVDVKNKQPKEQEGNGNQFGLPFNFPGMPQQPQQKGPQIEHGLGSGVIVSADGTILTNNHVVENATKITVDLSDKRSIEAKVIGTDKLSDLAVIKIEAKDLPFLPFGDSNKVRVGDIVLAIGNPLGIGQTVTAGIISAKGRATGLGDGNFEDFLQTDAPINQGNSGGALVNLSGELIGINSQILSRSGGSIGIGFSIPSNMTKNIMEQLVADGKVKRGMLGVIIQQVNASLAKQFGLPDTNGGLVSEVKPGSAAEKAGLKPGDVILSVNGEKAEDSNNVRNKVSSAKPGSEITLSIWRDKKEQELKVTLDEYSNELAKTTGKPGEEDDSAPQGKSDKKLGLTLQPLTDAIAKRLGITASAKGLVVMDIDPDGPSAESGIRQGDVIMEVNREKVETTDDVAKAIGENQGDGILLLVNRGGRTSFVTVEPQ
jgi:serine protease Do